LPGTDGNRRHKSTWAFTPYSPAGRQHREARRHSIVHYDYRSTRYRGWRPSFAIGLFAALQFALFQGGHVLNRLWLHLKSSNSLFIQHTYSAARQGPHSKLFVTGHAQFAHEKNVEFRPQRVSHFVTDCHTSAWQSQHQNVEIRK
jgi:hypothetical protein